MRSSSGLRSWVGGVLVLLLAVSPANAAPTCGIAAGSGWPQAGAESDGQREAHAAFVEAYRRPDGGYGAPEHPDSHEIWTSQAVRSLALLGTTPPERPALLARVRAFRADGPNRLARADALLATTSALGLPLPAASATEPRLEDLLPQLVAWEGSTPLIEVERARRVYPRVFSAASGVEAIRSLLATWRGDDGGFGYPVDLADVFRRLERARFGGSVPAARHPSSVEATAAGVDLARALALELDDEPAIAAWIESLRAPDGSFRATSARPTGNDLWAAWHALRTLDALGAPLDPSGETRRWLAGLRCQTGGFVHAPGERPALEATWLALECRALLGGALPLDVEPAPVTALPPPDDPGNLGLHQAAVEMGPLPEVSLELARRAGVDLVLIKGDADSLRARFVASLAAARGLSIAAGVGREEYHRAFGEPGVGYATHCSDLLFPFDAEVGRRGWYPSFRALVEAWVPARRAGAIVLGCAYRNRELLAPAYEAAARGEEGYDALVATWAFARDGDLIRDWPWLHRFVGRVPLIGNHDAHGDPFHWFHRGSQARTLFFARTSGVAGLREAIRHNRVVAVASRGDRTVYYGHPYWVARATRERARWDLGRPKPEADVWLPGPMAIPIDASSGAAWPEVVDGHAILIRAARRLWDDALPSEVRCRVDGRSVPLALVEPTLNRIPALMGRLGTLEPGAHEVFLEAFGTETRETVHFGQPVHDAASEQLRLPLGPSAMTFASPAEGPFLRVFPLPAPTPQGLLVQSGRADLILSPSPRADGLSCRWRGGGFACPMWLFLNGHALGALAPVGADEVRTQVFGLPPGALRSKNNWITLRTVLASWTPRSVTPTSDLVLEEVRFVDTGIEER